MSQWQPIETAPKDGTEILVYTIHGDCEITHYFVMTREVYDEAGDGLFTRRVETIHEGWNGNTPTHWMPLPPPPDEALPAASVVADDLPGESC